jgi:hypothetical protein
LAYETVFKNGIISKDGVNQGIRRKIASPAPGQSTASFNSVSEAIDALPGPVKDIGQNLFNGLGSGGKNFMSAMRGGNLPFNLGGKAPSELKSSKATFSGANVEEKDWRVSLSVPNHPSFATSDILEPLASTGNRFVFPYTPTIILQHSANYSNVSPIHNNYPFFAYQNSQVNELVIVGQFYVQNALEARYWVAALHYLRSITKMDFGMFGTGEPPRIVKLNGYGDFVFNDLSCVVTTFTVDMPNEVDYIATGLGNTNGDPAGSKHISWAPAESQFSVSVQPIYSRKKVSEFVYGSFVRGDMIDKGYI